jgi:hypothetical protein
MGATASNARSSSKSRSRKRGSVDNASRLAGIQVQENEGSGSASWERADPRWVAGVVVHCTLHGMEISFLISKTGAAHGLKLYEFETGERRTLWFNQDADLDVELEQLFYALGGV